MLVSTLSYEQTGWGFATLGVMGSLGSAVSCVISIRLTF